MTAPDRPVFTHAVTALSEHIDELGHVNNAVWVQWIQEVALAHWYSVADAAHVRPMCGSWCGMRSTICARRLRATC